MYDTSTNLLNVHEWAYGVTEIVHIVSLAAGIGLIFLVDLRLLGFGFRETPRRLLRAVTVPSVFGLVVAVTSGFMIFSTDPPRYFAHPTMRFKLTVLVVALVFNFAVHNPVARRDDPAWAGRAVAAASVLLWLIVVFSGLFYAFT
jgi:Family of unknown function (DUF6644)